MTLMSWHLFESRLWVIWVVVMESLTSLVACAVVLWGTPTNFSIRARTLLLCEYFLAQPLVLHPQAKLSSIINIKWEKIDFASPIPGSGRIVSVILTNGFWVRPMFISKDMLRNISAVPDTKRWYSSCKRCASTVFNRLTLLPNVLKFLEPISRICLSIFTLNASMHTLSIKNNGVRNQVFVF